MLGTGWQGKAPAQVTGTCGHLRGWICLEESVGFAKGIFFFAAAVALFPSAVLCACGMYSTRARSLRLPPAPDISVFFLPLP